MGQVEKVTPRRKPQSDFEVYQRTQEVRAEILRDWQRMKRSWCLHFDSEPPVEKALDVVLFCFVKRGLLK